MSDSPEGQSGTSPPTAQAYRRGETPARPPLLVGCATVVAVAVMLVVGATCVVVFFESGADSGTLVLEDAAAYAPGSVEFVSERNIFIVRTPEGAYFALDDLDAANRANQGRRCRVAVITPGDPALPATQRRVRANVSPEAARMPVLFREACNGAIYDAAGVRLDAPGARNLDRFRVGRDSQGKLRVETGVRICTKRDGDDWFASVECE